MKIRLVVIGLLLACLTVGIVPNWVNSYSGETIGDAALAGIAGCMANEAWKSVKSPEPAPTQSNPAPSRDEYRSMRARCYNACDERFPNPEQSEDYLSCIKSCR